MVTVAMLEFISKQSQNVSIQQRLVFLEQLEIDYPVTVKAFFMLFKGVTSVGNEQGETEYDPEKI